tara:strand:+ start:119 stop:319 length:201 start_codon:yes stop_codon:yes gene_type:complete
MQPGPAVATRARAALGDISNRGLAGDSKLGKAGGKVRPRCAARAQTPDLHSMTSRAANGAWPRVPR